MAYGYPSGSAIAQLYSQRENPWKNVQDTVNQYFNNVKRNELLEEERKRQTKADAMRQQRFNWEKQAQEERQLKRDANQLALGELAKGLLPTGATSAYTKNLKGIQDYGKSIELTPEEIEFSKRMNSGDPSVFPRTKADMERLKSIKEKEKLQSKLGKELVAGAQANPESRSSLYRRAVERTRDKTGYVPEWLATKVFETEAAEKQANATKLAKLQEEAKKLSESIGNRAVDLAKLKDTQISSMYSLPKRSKAPTTVQISGAVNKINREIDEMQKNYGLSPEQVKSLKANALNTLDRSTARGNNPIYVADSIVSSMYGKEGGWGGLQSPKAGINKEELNSVLSKINSVANAGGTSRDIKITENERRAISALTKADQAQLSNLLKQIDVMSKSPEDRRLSRIASGVSTDLKLPKATSDKVEVPKPSIPVKNRPGTTSNSNQEVRDVKTGAVEKEIPDKYSMASFRNLEREVGKTDKEAKLKEFDRDFKRLEVPKDIEAKKGTLEFTKPVYRDINKAITDKIKDDPNTSGILGTLNRGASAVTEIFGDERPVNNYTQRTKLAAINAMRDIGVTDPVEMAAVSSNLEPEAQEVVMSAVHDKMMLQDPEYRQMVKDEGLDNARDVLINTLLWAFPVGKGGGLLSSAGSKAGRRARVKSKADGTILPSKDDVIIPPYVSKKAVDFWEKRAKKLTTNSRKANKEANKK